MHALSERVRREVGKVVIGQDHVVDVLLAAAVVNGHVLLEGPPGVAKTLLANAFAKALDLEFRRIQFTPDMLPSDITGTMMLRPTATGGELTFRHGPVFTNVLLADEINRTPPKTQAALLEAMQENHVSIDGTAHPLPAPFVVIATQNPIEYEGTYPLPEAQLDRFFAKVLVGYPDAAAERALLTLVHHGLKPAALDDIVPVASRDDIAAAQREVEGVGVSDAVLDYVVAIARRTRELPSIALGASPRAAVHLLVAARAIAALAGRAFVIPEDVQVAVPTVLRHRLLLRPEAELEQYSPDDALRAAVASVPVPR